MHEAKTHFSKLVQRALAGEDVVIARHGKPVVRLTSVAAPSGVRTPGLSTGAATIGDDFDAPLPEEFWADSNE